MIAGTVVLFAFIMWHSRKHRRDTIPIRTGPDPLNRESINPIYSNTDEPRSRSASLVQRNAWLEETVFGAGSGDDDFTSTNSFLQGVALASGDNAV